MLYKIKRITLCLIIIGTSLGYAQNRSIEFDHSDWKALLEKANKERPEIQSSQSVISPNIKFYF